MKGSKKGQERPWKRHCGPTGSTGSTGSTTVIREVHHHHYHGPGTSQPACAQHLHIFSVHGEVGWVHNNCYINLTIIHRLGSHEGFHFFYRQIQDFQSLHARMRTQEAVDRAEMPVDVEEEAETGSTGSTEPIHTWPRSAVSCLTQAATLVGNVDGTFDLWQMRKDPYI